MRVITLTHQRFHSMPFRASITYIFSISRGSMVIHIYQYISFSYVCVTCHIATAAKYIHGVTIPKYIHGVTIPQCIHGVTIPKYIHGVTIPQNMHGVTFPKNRLGLTTLNWWFNGQVMRNHLCTITCRQEHHS